MVWVLQHEMVTEPWIFRRYDDARLFARARWGIDWESDENVSLRSQYVINSSRARKMALEELEEAD